MKKQIAYPIILVCCIIIAGAWYLCWFNPVTTIILVRHAEKDAGSDPPLTTEGHKRAGALAHAVSNAGVDVIFVSDMQFFAMIFLTPGNARQSLIRD
jgi:hypothetical protein